MPRRAPKRIHTLPPEARWFYLRLTDKQECVSCGRSAKYYFRYPNKTSHCEYCVLDYAKERISGDTQFPFADQIYSEIEQSLSKLGKKQN